MKKFLVLLLSTTSVLAAPQALHNDTKTGLVVESPVKVALGQFYLNGTLLESQLGSSLTGGTNGHVLIATGSTTFGDSGVVLNNLQTKADTQPFVSLKHKDGSTTAYQPSSSTDTARGTAFKAANTAAVSGDTLLFSGPIDMGTDGITIKDGVTYFGLGSTITLNNSAGATKNIFIDNSVSVQCRIGGNIRFEAFGGTGAETIRAIYATGDGTIIHVAPTVEFEIEATANVLLPALQAASGATIYADGVLIQDGTVVVESGGSISINHAKLFDCNIDSAGDLYAAGIESLDGKISITAGDAYLDNVNIFSPGEFPALTVSGSAVVYASGRFRANGTNSNAITVGPSTILTLNGGTDLIATGSGKAIGKSSGTPTVTLRGAVRGNAAADVAIIFAGGTDIGNLYQAYDVDLTTWAGITPGIGVGTALAVNVGSAGAFVTFNGALGTPSSGTGTNLTGIPESGVTNLVSDLALKSPLASPTFTGVPAAPTATGGTNTTQLATTAFVTSAVSTAGGSYQPLDSDLTSWAAITRASGFDTFTVTPSSANLKSLVTDETGSGALVFGTSPTFTTGITIGAGSAITSSGAGGTLGTGAFAAAFDSTVPGAIGGGTPGSGAFTTLTNTGAATNSKSGAASVAAYLVSGVPFAGTGTTSFPLVYINDANATASTTLNTAGTYFGVNGDGSQDLMNLLKDGTSIFVVKSNGNVGVGMAPSVSFDVNGGIRSSSLFAIASKGRISSGAADGILVLQDDVTNLFFTRLDFGGTSNSYGAIGSDSVNGFTIQSAAGTATWNDRTTANSGTVANRYLFGIATPTLTATGTSVTDTVASTVYIGGAPTASTNTTIGTAYALNVAAGDSAFGGNIIATTVGKGLQVKGGTNAKIGSGTLTAGTVTISTTAVTANSRIFLTDTSTGSLVNVGSLVVSTKTVGSGFVVTSTNTLDASTFDWMIVEQN